MQFIDQARISVRGGRGGDGIVAFRREKYVPAGGPSGGDGGHGAHVVLEADSNLQTLLDFKYKRLFAATDGRRGGPNRCTGASGQNLVIPVPCGTEVRHLTTGILLGDLTSAGEQLTVAFGGRGGLGNAHYLSNRNRAPEKCTEGRDGEEWPLQLELKLLAEVGIIGLPNAGKSTLISVLSAARPKIADYPFTTLVPNLGVVSADDIVFTVADVPGLIPGASDGKGLGLEFLRHVERCSVLVHVVDCATLESERDPLVDVDMIESELAAYGGLADRPRLIALNKVDVPDGRAMADMVRGDLEARGYRVFNISAATHEGLRPLVFAMGQLVVQARADQVSDEATRVIIRPTPVDDAGFTIEKEVGGFRVVGARPERWVRQTDFSNDEAVGYLADRLARLGVEDELRRQGAEPGTTVMIGVGEDAVVFDWYPTLVGDVPVSGPRGSDDRLHAAHHAWGDDDE